MTSTGSPGPAGQSATWTYPTTVLYGAGGIRKLARACEGAGIRRPLLVADPGLARLAPFERTWGALREAKLEPVPFHEVRPNPVGANVEAGVAAFRSTGCDGVVALGGGSALDVGKVVAFMAGQTRPLWDFEDRGDWWRRADPAGIRPVVAIPTTAGTGSEVGRAGVISDEGISTKRIIFHPAMMPKVAILDPKLTVGLPPDLTAATGMDALAHCLEAYCARGFHPMAEGIAVEGLRLVLEALPRACADGSDLEARGSMLVASAMGAVAFQKGLGAIHSLSHPIGAVHGTHHGLTNAVLMPYVLGFNRPAIEAKLDRLAAWLGLSGSSGYVALLDRVLALRERIGIPRTLQAQGVPDECFGELAAKAIEDPTAPGNPRPFSAADARRMLEDAWAGRLT